MRAGSTLALIALLVAGQTAEADTIRIGLRILPNGLGNPFGSFNLPSALPLDSIYDGLTTIDENGETRPALAESWEQEGQSWVFYLRPGVRFSNGEPFDAAAVVAAVDVLLSPEGSGTSFGTAMERQGVSGAEIRGPLTVVIHTTNPDVIFPQYMQGLRLPAPTHLAELGLEAFARDPVGTGPYRVVEWVEGRITLQAYADSWRTPKEESIELLQLSDPASRRQGIISGSLDIALDLSPDDRTPLEAVGGRLWERREPATNFLAFVTVKDSPLQDVRVRRALNHAVNKQRMIDAFLDGTVEPASQIAHSMSFGYNHSLEPYPYDPDKAQALLAEAGYPDGFDLPTLYVSGGGANSTDWYQQIAADLARVGIHMEIRGSTMGRYLEYMYYGGWPGLAFAMSTYTFDPLAGYRTRSCAWQNPYHCDPGMMPLIEAARAAPTLDERRQRTWAVLKREHDNPPGIFLWQGVAFEGLGPRIADYWSGADTLPVENITLKK